VATSKTKSRQLAQERARQIVAAQKRAEARRRRLQIAASAIAAVVVIFGAIIVVRLATRHHPAAAASASQASAGVLAGVTGVPAAVFDQVGAGQVSTPPSTLTGQPALTDGGKPLVVYIGAEYCPFCAAERWAMVAALSRFGTFSNLGQTHSSSTDVYPNTPTLSFHEARYTSQYLSFQGVETQSNQPSGGGYAALDTPTSAQQQVLNKYDATPYVPSGAAGSIPFIDFGNQAVVSGASYSPQLLAGKTADQIAAALSDPSSPIAKAVDGTANAFTTLLCGLTHNQPSTVCISTGATAYQGKLHAAG
jgi:thiol-disulfide isomerase/thioredoxin